MEANGRIESFVQEIKLPEIDSQLELIVDLYDNGDAAALGDYRGFYTEAYIKLKSDNTEVKVYLGTDIENLQDAITSLRDELTLKKGEYIDNIDMTTLGLSKYDPVKGVPLNHYYLYEILLDNIIYTATHKSSLEKLLLRRYVGLPFEIRQRTE